MELDGTDVAAVRDAEASAWLDAPAELASSTRSLAEKIFEAGVRYLPKNPLRRLLTQGFDAEQIWQQMEIQDRPLLSIVRRQIEALEKLGGGDVFGLERYGFVEEGKNAGEEMEGKNGGEEMEEYSGGSSSGDEDGEEEDGSGDEEEEATENVLEDKFLKLKDMDKFLLDAEEQYARQGEEGDEDDEDDEEDGDEDDGDIRYEDFYGKLKSSRKDRFKDKEMNKEQRESEEEEEENGNEDVEEDEEHEESLERAEVTGRKSSHEMQLEKTQKRIEQLEKANLDTKDWTMRGEVTAAKRPKNSALEVDLDFEHNIRPAPVITEEVTTSLEDVIRRRIIEGQFDDVERKQKLPEMPPAQKVEIDETKSKKGLGELYEEEFMQSAGFATAPETEQDKLKKEARDVFKRLCIKLDALAHFHFAPKPVIEEMTVNKDVPALAMEEVAPMFVSDASMLAPEEMFSGKGAIKDEKELDRSDRKRRRASKKRKFKARQKAEGQTQVKKPRTSDKTEEPPHRAVPAASKAKQNSKFVKSAKVFADLDRQKNQPKAKEPKPGKSLQPSSFKL